VFSREAEKLPALAGRDRELAAGERLLDAIRRGRPGVVELVGEAGIGKTALATAVAAHAERRGHSVLRTRAAAFERDVPYGLWIELLDGAVETLPPTALAGLGTAHCRELARLLPALRDGQADAQTADASSSAARFRLHRAVGALVAALAGRGPLVLVLDDLHWADPAGLELVLHLLRHPPDAGVLFVLACRPGPAADALAEAARDLPARAQLELGPLPDAAARALLGETAAGDADALLARARGNPLFLLELARAGDGGGPLPRSLQAVIDGTTRTLSPAARALLDGAALAGDPFEVPLAAAAGGLLLGASAGAASAPGASDPHGDATPAPLIPNPDAAVDELLDAGLVALDGGDLRCRFRHPLVRQAVHERLGVERRRAGHAALAGALRERGADPRALAPHVALAALPGDTDAIDLLDRAAADAHAVAPDAAARWLAVAERLLPATPEQAGRRLELRLRRSLALAAAGAVQEAHGVLVTVERDLPPGSPLAVMTTAQLAQIERAGGRAHDARARLERALAAGIATNVADEAQLHVGLAFTLVQLHDRDAGATVRAALAAAERAGSRLGVASARACASVLASWEGDHAGAAAAVAESLADLTRLADDELAQGLETVYMLALMAIANERFADADALLERGAMLARRTGQDWALAALLSFRGMSRWNLGDMPGAIETVEEGIEIARLIRAEATLGHALSLACNLHIRAGDRAAGERAGEESLRILARQQPDVLTATSRLNAVLFMALDVDPARALREATAVAGSGLEATDASWICQLSEALIGCALSVGDRAAARAWAQRATAVAEHARLPLALAKAASARALSLSADGEHDAALAAARDGLAQAEPLGTTHAAFARSTLGRVLAAAGEHAAATEELQRAATDFAACGLQRAHDQAAREIRRLGGRVSGRIGRAAGVEGLGELSEREREIARLIAAGTPNKRIAMMLHLSEKTVANHLTNVYAKLGLRGRTELAALVATATAGGGGGGAGGAGVSPAEAA
jgi:DNA-binding CsgD family transcriptional regulator